MSHLPSPKICYNIYIIRPIAIDTVDEPVNTAFKQNREKGCVDGNIVLGIKAKGMMIIVK